MNLRKFLSDRLGYILLYFFNTFLVILIMHLTLLINGKGFVRENIPYAFICSAVFLAVLIIFDYIRKKPFYMSLNRIRNMGDGIESIFKIGEVHGYEQREFKATLQASYRSYKENLVKHEEMLKQQVYFMNQWAHQMKTPVSVISLLVQENEGGDTANALESIREENEKLSHGLEMALYTVRLNNFNLDFKAEQVDMVRVLRDVVNEHKKSCIRYSVFPRITGEAELFVETDAKWIRFVINQIIVNAVKYSRVKNGDRKSIHIHVSRETNRGLVSIQDEGVGIPRQDLGRVFDAFFTGENGRRYSESTGMGMYLSKRICDEMGHSIYVESEEGKWTRFTIAFNRGGSIFRF